MKKFIEAVCLVGSLSLSGCFVALGEEDNQQNDERPVQVMVLGTYHFSNPGMDLNNVEADDVLSERRQHELAEIARALSTFKPTVIAIEREAEPPYDDPTWETYTPEMMETVRNERVQIGYRVARWAGAKRVIAIDEQTGDGEPSYFPYDTVLETAEKTGQTEFLSELSDAREFMQGMKEAEGKSIAHALLFTNTDASFDPFYWDVIKVADGEDQSGAELAAYWFLRNAKIFSKLEQAAKPGDRVLVVYGSGHNYWLKEIAEKTSGYELVDVVPYLETAIRALEPSEE